MDPTVTTTLCTTEEIEHIGDGTEITGVFGLVITLDIGQAITLAGVMAGEVLIMDGTHLTMAGETPTTADGATHTITDGGILMHTTLTAMATMVAIITETVGMVIIGVAQTMAEALPTMVHAVT